MSAGSRARGQKQHRLGEFRLVHVRRMYFQEHFASGLSASFVLVIIGKSRLR